MTPVLEKLFEAGDGGELIRDCNIWSIVEGIGEEVECTENAVLVRDGGLGEIVVSKLDCVGEDEGFGGGVDDLEATVVIEGGADVEAIATAEGPGRACAGFVVDEDWAADGTDGRGVEIEGAVVVFPGGYFGG